MDAHEAQEVDGRGKKHVPASQPPWSYCMNGINLRKISMENPGKITQKLLNTHYNVFLLPPSRSRSIIYGGRNAPFSSDIESKREKIAATMKNGVDDASTTSL